MEEQSSKNYILFLGLYGIIYIGTAIYNTFLPVYLNNIGLSKTSIASLLSIGPLIAILAQPIWGSLGDRSDSKNRILQILLLGSALTILLFPLSEIYIYLLIVICLTTFFQTSIYPLSDAITLEYLSRTKWNFGPIRLAGQ
nr:MFS transporter [Bacillus canaveralius]